MFAVGVGALGWAQAAGVVGVAKDAARWVEVGAAVRIIDFPNLVDGAQCEALTSLDGVVAAGAVRSGNERRLAAMPSRSFETFEVTPAMAEVLNLRTPEVAEGLGVWLASDLAEALAAKPGRTMTVRALHVPATVAGVFDFPADDGRNPALAYSLIEPVAATGVFDACWITAWPERLETDVLARLVANPAPIDESGQRPIPQVGQLNASLGISFDAHGRLARLPTSSLIAAAGLFGLVLGIGLIRLRRLELASALHAGVPKSALGIQTAAETLTWVIAASVLLIPVLWFASTNDNPDSPWPAMFPATQTVAIAGIAVLLGTIGATLATREKHLFRLFKNR
ncbi:MAG: hypothetical protein FWD59_05065 [Micrococcales bacterium]|nr:hypothetical protein [Micrococcales bacterium]